jgi:hypothetical protein
VIRELANVALLVAALGCVAFVVAYHILAEWRRTALGRNVMAFMAVAGILLTIGVARAFFDLSHYLEWIRLGAYVMIAYIVWRRFYLLLKAQRVIDGEEKTDDDNPKRGRPDDSSADRRPWSSTDR